MAINEKSFLSDIRKGQGLQSGIKATALQGSQGAGLKTIPSKRLMVRKPVTQNRLNVVSLKNNQKVNVLGKGKKSRIKNVRILKEKKYKITPEEDARLRSDRYID